MGLTGTVRMNRLHSVPIRQKKEMARKVVDRGTTDILYKDDIVLVAWKDNCPCYMASNKYSASSEGVTCR